MNDNYQNKREKLNEMWETIDCTSIDDVNFNQKAPKLLEFLIVSVLNEENISIGTYGDEYSSITYNHFNTDKMLTLTLDKNSAFELELTLYDYDYEEIKYPFKLANQDLKIIPEGLVDLMRQVMETMEPMTIKTKSLDK